jgi:hypothetical protein
LLLKISQYNLTDRNSISAGEIFGLSANFPCDVHVLSEIRDLRDLKIQWFMISVPFKRTILGKKTHVHTGIWSSWSSWGPTLQLVYPKVWAKQTSWSVISGTFRHLWQEIHTFI